MTEKTLFKKPYEDFAVIYDQILGYASFLHWKKYFSFLVKKYNIKYESAADIACGSGRVANYFSGKAKIVFGVDLSRSMLRIARRGDKRNVKFINASFTDFRLPHKVDLITCNFDSLNYILKTKDLKKTLKNIFVSLNNSGWAVFDLNTIYHLGKNWGSKEFVLDGKNYFSFWKTKWNEKQRLNYLKMINFIKQKDGFYKKSAELHKEKGYPLGEFKKYIIQAGFTIKGAFDIFTLGKVNSKTCRVLFVVQKYDH